MKVFIQIGKIEKTNFAEKEDLKAISSIYSITETVCRSSSGYFIVHVSYCINDPNVNSPNSKIGIKDY